MNKADRFFRGLALVCVGVIVGFLLAPIKKGIRVTIGSNNHGSDVMNEYGMDEDWDDEDWDDEWDEEAPEKIELPEDADHNEE